MNAHIQAILTQEARRYKANNELKEQLKQNHQEALKALESAKERRSDIITNFAYGLGEQDAAKVKETIALLDKVIIPNLKTMEKAAYNAQFTRYGIISYRELVILVTAAMFSFQYFLYGGIFGIITAVVVWGIIFFGWLRYRVIIRRIACKEV